MKKYFRLILEQKSLLKSILNAILLNDRTSSWLATEANCKEHKIFMIQSAIKIRIYYKTKVLVSENIESKQKKRKDKNENKIRKVN